MRLCTKCSSKSLSAKIGHWEVLRDVPLKYPWRSRNRVTQLQKWVHFTSHFTLHLTSHRNAVLGDNHSVLGDHWHSHWAGGGAGCQPDSLHHHHSPRLQSCCSAVFCTPASILRMLDISMRLIYGYTGSSGHDEERAAFRQESDTYIKMPKQRVKCIAVFKLLQAEQLENKWRTNAHIQRPFVKNKECHSREQQYF